MNGNIVLLQEVQQLKEAVEGLKSIHQADLKELQSSQNNILQLLNKINAKDREQKLIFSLRRKIELDYDVHVQDNLKAWTAESCKSCRSIREIMSKYDDLDGTPILRNEVEEQELLRHLNKITRRSERTMAEDEIIRRGYYKILHRVINSMATMDRRDDMDRARLKRCVYYISSRLCEYWNSGIPIIFSHDQETEIRLVSSQAVFHDLWSMIRNQMVHKERARLLVTGCNLVGTKKGMKVKVKVQAEEEGEVDIKSDHSPKSPVHSGSQNFDSNSIDSDSSSINTSVASSDISRTSKVSVVCAVVDPDSPVGSTSASTSNNHSCTGSARRHPFSSVARASAVSMHSTPRAVRSSLSTPRSKVKVSPMGKVSVAKGLASAKKNRTRKSGSYSESSDEDSSDSSESSASESDSESENDHENGRTSAAESLLSESSEEGSDDACSVAAAEEEKEESEGVVSTSAPLRHLGATSKMFSPGQLDRCSTPASQSARMILSGVSMPSDSDSEVKVGPVLRSNNQCTEVNNIITDAVRMKDQTGNGTRSGTGTGHEEEDENDLLFVPTPTKGIGSPSVSSQASTPRRVHVRWPLLATSAGAVETTSPTALTAQSDRLFSCAMTPDCSVQSGASRNNPRHSRSNDQQSPVSTTSRKRPTTTTTTTTTSSSSSPDPIWAQHTPAPAARRPCHAAPSSLTPSCDFDGAPLDAKPSKRPKLTSNTPMVRPRLSHRYNSDNNDDNHDDDNDNNNNNDGNNAGTPASVFSTGNTHSHGGRSNWSNRSPSVEEEGEDLDLSSVCTSATTPNHALQRRLSTVEKVKFDTQRAQERKSNNENKTKSIVEQAKIKRRNRKINKLKNMSTSSVVKASVENLLSPGPSGDNENSAFSAILKSFKTPSPQAQQ